MNNTEIKNATNLVPNIIPMKATAGKNLPELTDEEKIRALKKSANRKGLVFDEKVQSYILNHTSRSLSDLLKLLVDLDTFSLERKRKISISLIKDLLSN